MALFQWQKIDPSADELESVLSEAARSAGLRHPDEAERRDLWTQAKQASGSRAWGPGKGATKPFRQVTCAWWTDRMGRRHWYVEGDEYRAYGEPDPQWRCMDGAVAHPLCAIDPLHTAVRGDGSERTLLVVCDCGEVGTPKALGWTGECCSPCFDRRAEDVAQPARSVHAHRTGVASLVFVEDGQILSLGYGDGAVHFFDEETGEAVMLAPPGDLGGAGLVSLPDGAAAVAYTRGEVVCWDLDSGEKRWHVDCRGEPWRRMLA